MNAILVSFTVLTCMHFSYKVKYLAVHEGVTVISCGAGEPKVLIIVLPVQGTDSCLNCAE